MPKINGRKARKSKADKTPASVMKSKPGTFNFYIENHVVATFKTMAQCDALTFAYFEVMGGLPHLK